MLRVLAVLAALTVVGGVLRFDAAADPSAYQSKDEQSYAMIARALAVTGHYGNPGMSDPVHWPPGAPLLFAAVVALSLLGVLLFNAVVFVERIALPWNRLATETAE